MKYYYQNMNTNEYISNMKFFFLLSQGHYSINVAVIIIFNILNLYH